MCCRNWNRFPLRGPSGTPLGLRTDFCNARPLDPGAKVSQMRGGVSAYMSSLSEEASCPWTCRPNPACCLQAKSYVLPTG